MNRGLALRYMELSCLLLAPITPHTSEHVWSVLLTRQGSVLRAGWPTAAEPDFIMQRAAQYIEGECISKPLRFQCWCFVHRYVCWSLEICVWRRSWSQRM